MLKPCSNCDSSENRLIGRVLTYPVPMVFLVIGGLFFAIVYAESRMRISWCPSCKHRIACRTTVSWIFLPLFWICVVGITIKVLSVLGMIMVGVFATH